MKYLKRINENNTISSNNLYVIYTISDTEVNEVFMDKEQAEQECLKRNKDWNDHYKLTDTTLYSVKTLNQAIDLIKEYIRDEYASWGSPGY